MCARRGAGLGQHQHEVAILEVAMGERQVAADPRSGLPAPDDRVQRLILGDHTEAMLIAEPVEQRGEPPLRTKGSGRTPTSSAISAALVWSITPILAP